MAYLKYLCFSCLFYAAHAAAIEPSTLCFPKEDFQTSNEQLNNANAFFEAALHTKAIDAYKKLIEELLLKPEKNEDDISLLMQARFHLAQTHFSMGNFRDAVSVLNENVATSPKVLQLHHHSLYLKALALKNLKETEQAKNAFLSYAFATTPSPLPFHEEALFEIGLIDFDQERYKDAYAIFESIDPKQRLYPLSQLYLARIEQNQNNHPAASKILKALVPKIENNEPLFFELNYLLGEAAFQLHDHANAIESFNKALPPSSPEKYPWYANTLSHLGWSHFKIGNDTSKDTIARNNSLQQAEIAFDRLLAFSKEENAALALVQCYLSQAAHAKAEALLSRQDLFLSKEAKTHALLLRAEAAPTYEDRDQFYQKLTQEPNDSIFYAQGWYMRALNDFEYAQKLSDHAAAQQAFVRSAKAFAKSFELLREKDPQQAGAALKYQALATGDSSSDGALKAFQILERLVQDPLIWNAYANKDEIYYLHGYFAGKEKQLETARKSLLAAASNPNSLFGDQAYSYLGSLYYNNEEYEKAEETYLQLAQTYPSSPLAAEAWVWSACCADILQPDLNIGKERRKYAFEHFPDSPYAAEAFFTYYTYPEYLQGDRTTIKHLQNFTDRYTESPLLIDAHYLIGLDYKRDRKTEEGRWIRKKSLTDAIDSFQKAETFFDELSEKKQIPSEKMNYYTAMRYRATLERALANLAIAEEAQGAKKQVYLNYAEEVFENLAKELKNPEIFQENPFPLIEEECCFGLAQTYIKGDKDEEAEKVLSAMAERYNSLNIIKGYYLSRTRDEQGRIAMRQQKYPQALDYFRMAEEAAKGKVLSTDQKLDLWIQQSYAYRGLGQFDDAILILSKVVNDDAVSSLRMKAMYLRAETYEQQKRPELARKQLESMVKKGGIWAQKAQEKLDKDGRP